MPSLPSHPVLRVLLLGSLLGACSREPPPEPVGPPAAPPTRSYRYGGVGAFSRLEQRTAPDGSEELRSETEVRADPTLGAGASRIRLVETATLDPSGRLIRGEICRTAAERGPVCFRLDAGSGTILIERAPGDAVAWRVPTDAPWVVQGTVGEPGELVSTPLAGWIALRAASGREVVRVVEPGAQTSYLAPVDQVAVATETGTMVVLGGDGIDVAAGVIREVRLLHLRTTLTLLPASSEPGT